MNSNQTITIGYEVSDLNTVNKSCLTSYKAFMSCEQVVSILRTTTTWDLLKLWNINSVRFIEFESFANDNVYLQPDNTTQLGALATGFLIALKNCRQ